MVFFFGFSTKRICRLIYCYEDVPQNHFGNKAHSRFFLVTYQYLEISAGNTYLECAIPLFPHVGHSIKPKKKQNIVHKMLIVSLSSGFKMVTTERLSYEHSFLQRFFFLPALNEASAKKRGRAPNQPCFRCPNSDVCLGQEGCMHRLRA